MPRRSPRKAVTGTRLGNVARDVFKLEGVDEVKENIANILDRTTGEKIKKVYMRAAMIAVREARSLVPVRTGKLRDAIFADYGDPAKPNVLVGVNYKKAPHAHLVEFGTVKTSAHPYFRPAITATRGPMAATIIEGFKEILDESTK